MTASVNAHRQLARNAATSWAASFIKVCVQLALLPVMARLLGPSEFGLFALALPTVMFFVTLADGGLGASLSREPEGSTLVWSTAFWVVMGSSAVMAAMVVAAGFVMARLLGQPRLFELMALLSTSLIFLALATVPDARLIRRGNFVFHSVGDLVASLAGSLVAVVLAAAHFGAWSLAWQYVVAFAVRALFLNLGAFEWPGLQFDLPTLRAHVATGGAVAGSKLAELLGRSIENMVFGRIFGASTLGAYTLANQMCRFLCDAAGNPLWGSLYAHSLHERDPRVLAAFHARLSRLLASLLFPTTFIVSACAPQLIEIIMGPRWAAAARMMQMLAPFFAIGSVGNLCGAILLAEGRNAPILRIAIGLAVLRILAVCIGFMASPAAVALGAGLAYVASALCLFAALSATRGTSLRKLADPIVAPFASALAGGLSCLIATTFFPHGWLGTMAAMAVGLLACLGAMMLLEGTRLRSDIAALRRLATERAA
jgi:PST family polysaccharide transporter